MKPKLDAGEEAVVIGQGNVALDVARILLSDVDALRKTDISAHALEALSNSRVKSVKVVGRRGPMQAAYTIKEIRELMNLPGVAFMPLESSLLPSDVSSLPRAQKRMLDVIKKGSKTPESSSDRTWSLNHFLSPTHFNSSDSNPNYLSDISFNQTTFVPSSDPLDAKAAVEPTGNTTSIPASLAFRSVGYKSSALPGFSDLGIPFDERKGIIPNDIYGRVIDPKEAVEGCTDALLAPRIPGLYCSGWVKKGPTGVIASTMLDAFSTADALAQDWTSGTVPFLNAQDGGSTGLGWDGVKAEAEKRGLRRVSWDDWQKIDAVEKSRGKETGKEREKIASVEEMLAVLD